jgi:hypothetical protein
MTAPALQRRTLLQGLVWLAAAPAIVRASSLMPIKSFETFGPGGILTIEQITKEMARLLAKRSIPPLYGSSDVDLLIGNNQSHVSLISSQQNRTLSLEDFSRRILEPAAKCLNGHVGSRHIGSLPPEVPEGVIEGAAISRNGIGVRGVMDYCIEMDQVLLRLDVTHD